METRLSYNVVLKEEARLELRKLQHDLFYRCYNEKTANEMKAKIRALYADKNNFGTILEIRF